MSSTVTAKKANQNLTKAKNAKQDEFYTQLTDIEKELNHYRKHFRGKVVYCNCDDPKVSNFFRYFFLNFQELGLKRLVSTCYRNENSGERSRNASKHAVCLEYDGEKETLTRLEGDGDFRSPECVALLDKADIVVTNPPFSLFREYVALLVERGKKFLIVGNMNASTYKDIFKLIKEGKLWLGPSIHSGDREFEVPNGYPLLAAGTRIDSKGRKFIRVKGVRWFTNMDHHKRHEDLFLNEPYSAAEYPTYDNYNAINVNKTADIPENYSGVMGVPITFLDKYNPDQFKIIGIDRYVEDNPHPGKRFTIGGKEIYARILIQNNKAEA